MEPQYHLHSARLRLRPVRRDDLDAILALWTDPSVRRFLFDDRVIARDGASAFVEDSAANFCRCGYGLWLVFASGQPRIAGFAGLLHPLPQPPSLLFGTHPECWNRGYATEAARAVLQHAFEVLGLGCVVADVGMSRTNRALVNGRPLLCYEMARALPR
jgi:ribosomal-protein-alanine N-acetyltransferase